MSTDQYMPPHPQQREQDRMPQVYDKWQGKRKRSKRDYLEEDEVSEDWTDKFYKAIFPAAFLTMFVVNCVISLPVMKRAQDEYHWYDHWAIIIAFGFTIAVLACIYYYFIGPLRDVRRND